jgi:hypothetical protein
MAWHVRIGPNQEGQVTGWFDLRATRRRRERGCHQAEQGRPVIARYAWVLVAMYSMATVAGNALVAGTQTIDPRLVRSIGDNWAHAVSGIAHAAPAVTMILFAHLAGLLMGGTARQQPAAARRRPWLDRVHHHLVDLAARVAGCRGGTDWTRPQSSRDHAGDRPPAVR